MSGRRARRLYRPGFPGTSGVLPGGGWLAEPVPGPQTSMPSEVLPRVPSGAIGPTSVKARPAGRAGGLAGLITRSFPRMEAIISFCTTWATMFRAKVGGLISPQSSCAMSKYTGVADDDDVSEGRQRVGVVAAAAHHAPQPVAHQEKGEDLLVHAQRAERGRDPRADEVRRPQRLDGPGLPVGRRPVRAPPPPPAAAPAGRAAGSAGGVPGGR